MLLIIMDVETRSVLEKKEDLPELFVPGDSLERITTEAVKEEATESVLSLRRFPT